MGLRVQDEAVLTDAEVAAVGVVAVAVRRLRADGRRLLALVPVLADSLAVLLEAGLAVTSE